MGPAAGGQEVDETKTVLLRIQDVPKAVADKFWSELVGSEIYFELADGRAVWFDVVDVVD